jgi:signal transduction histidine kinase
MIGKAMIILELIDVTSAVLLWKFMAFKNEILQLINANVSHEMKNPLNSIIIQNFLLKEELARL